MGWWLGGWAAGWFWLNIRNYLVEPFSQIESLENFSDLHIIVKVKDQPVLL